MRLVGYCFSGATLEQLDTLVEDLIELGSGDPSPQRLTALAMLLSLKSEPDLCERLACALAGRVAKLPSADRERSAASLGTAHPSDALSDLVGPKTRFKLAPAIALREAQELRESLQPVPRASRQAGL